MGPVQSDISAAKRKQSPTGYEPAFQVVIKFVAVGLAPAAKHFRGGKSSENVLECTVQYSRFVVWRSTVQP